MIKVKDVSMVYRMSGDKILSLKEYFITAVKRELNVKEFWALSDIDFQVSKGEILGIIGNNGAGKSTLLKIIAGIMKPIRGTVEVNGGIVPMLELGSGFDYDLTGKENIFLNGAILGYSESFLEEKYDEIVEFSELEEFIDQPLRNYSSGMAMRLAFSIATVVHPEVLILDEILAVGDDSFQKKSRKRMLSLMKDGTTVILVSHNIEQIRSMSDVVLWLDRGNQRMFGETKLVCDIYEASSQVLYGGTQ